MRLYKIKFVIFEILYYTFILALLLIILALANGYIEKGTINVEINNFKKRSDLSEIVYINKQKVEIYKIKPTYDYEVKDTRNTFINNDNNYIGSKGDIIITDRNPLKNYNGEFVKIIVGYITKLMFSGHASVVINEDSSEIIESTGNDEGFCGVRVNNNYWINGLVNNEIEQDRIIGLRIKDKTAEQIDEFVEDLEKEIGKSYSYNYVFSLKDKYYCTDLISRIAIKSNIHLNYDFFSTTGNDIIISNETFIFFLCERIDKGYYKIYFLGE